MIPSTSTGLLRLAAGISANPDAARSAEQASAQCAEALGAGSTDLAIAFISYHHVESMDTVAAAIKRELRADCLIGVTGEGVVGGRTELERTPAISILAARLPGVSIVPFTGQELMPYDESPEGLAKVGRSFGGDDQLRAAFVFADPFSVPMTGLLPILNRARSGGKVGAIIGGMAAGATQAGGNALLLDDAVYRSGLVGVGLRGALRVDSVVSQGCRAFGPTMVVTKAKKNIIFELGGQPAINAVREAVETIPDEDKKLLERGLFIGRVINEYKDRFGRDDFLIRNVIGVDENHGAIAVAELMRVGQTVRLHLRDAQTADEDLAMLLDAQQLRDPPVGAMMVTCNGRGSRLFDRPHHDAEAVARAFAPGRSGEELSKGGQPIDADGPTLPVAGFFAAGEIGPVGDESYLHGQTAVLALFRNPR